MVSGFRKQERDTGFFAAKRNYRTGKCHRHNADAGSAGKPVADCWQPADRRALRATCFAVRMLDACGNVRGVHCQIRMRVVQEQQLLLFKRR